MSSVRTPAAHVNQLSRAEAYTATEIRDSHGYFKIPYEAMQTVGSAARTFGAMQKLAGGKSRSLWWSHEKIAAMANLPLKTVRRHLDQLIDEGWIIDHGRRPQCRTHTYEIPEWAYNLEPYGVMPRWWLMADWVPTAIYSVILANNCVMERLTEERMPSGEPIEDFVQKSAREFSEITGLSRRSVFVAIAFLKDQKLIHTAECANGETGYFVTTDC